MTASRDRRVRRPDPPRRCGLIRLLAVTAIATVVLGLAACSSDGDGAGFGTDPAPIDPSLVAALGDGVDPDAVPAVQRDFLVMCVEGVDDSTEDLAPLERTGLLAVCGCSYRAIVEDLRGEAEGDTDDERDRAAYDALRDIEADLRAGNALSDEIEGLVAACIRSEAGL